ncbi:MAG: GNAT family N-acetyltransferase [Alphaproteobacteria bacterium]|nr:GNAT family N-acetyltransferase [Alphaproteobacteria bacterium]
MKFAVQASIADAEGGAVADLYADRAEGPGFIRAWEMASGGENQRFVTATNSGALVAASPAFLTKFNWLSIMPGTKGLARRDPAFGRISMAGLGLVQASELGLRLKRGLSASDQSAAFGGIVDGLEQLGERQRSNFLLIKDLNDRDAAIAGPILARRGFAPMGALPQAFLHLPFGSMDAYLASLSRNRRRSLLRNVARAKDVQVETGADISGLVDALHGLSEQTRQQAAVQFSGLEATPKAFFPAIQDVASKHCWFVLYRLEGALIGFTFNMIDGRVHYAKSIGLAYPQALEHKVYFLNLFKTIEKCITAGIEWLALGQLAYDTKLALGCKLEKRWLYLKGRGIFRPGFGLVKPIITRLPLDPSFKPFDRPEAYFANNMSGPQPPVNTIFGPG